MITKDNFTGALSNLIDSYVLPLLRSEQAQAADNALYRYRQALVANSRACCERWALFYHDMDGQSNFVASPHAGQRKTVHWCGHTFVCCPFCGERLDKK